MRILHSKKLVFISKPRCGSTSVRNFLTKNCVEGDIICNTVDREKGLHPHMSATSIKAYIDKEGYNSNEYKYFTVTRNPLDMLWSYFKYFKPDTKCRYNYSELHNPESLMEFDKWILKGHVGIGKYWAEYVPEYVTAKNFSPLSLEAHVCNQMGEIDVDNIFFLEDLDDAVEWLQGFFDDKVVIPNVNGTDVSSRPEISEPALVKLRLQFPMESTHYNI